MVTWDHKLYGEQQTLDLLWRQKINYVKAPQKAEEFVSTPKIFWRHKEEECALS